MKITKSRLQQIIQEELSRVLEEEVGNDLDTDNDGKISAAELADEIEDMADDLYVVIGNRGHGQQNMYPEALSKEEAQDLADERNMSRQDSFPPERYHVKPLTKAAKHVSMGSSARAVLNTLLDTYKIRS